MLVLCYKLPPKCADGLKLGSQYANADLTQQFIRKIEISSILRLTCVCIKLT